MVLQTSHSQKQMWGLWRLTIGVNSFLEIFQKKHGISTNQHPVKKGSIRAGIAKGSANSEFRVNPQLSGIKVVVKLMKKSGE